MLSIFTKAESYAYMLYSYGSPISLTNQATIFCPKQSSYFTNFSKEPRRNLPITSFLYQIHISPYSNKSYTFRNLKTHCKFK